MKLPVLLRFTRILALLYFCSNIFIGAGYAAGFLDEARRFISLPNISLDENQKFIARVNQFAVEGDYSAAELSETLLIRAIVFSRLKDFDNAFESYAAAIDSKNLTPILNAEALKNRGLLYYQTKQYIKSKNDFVAALEILKGNAELHYYTANAYFGMLHFDEAVDQYIIALDGMSNKRFLAYYGIASVYFQQQRFEESKQYILLSLEDYNAFKPAETLLKEIEKLEGINETTQISNPSDDVLLEDVRSDSKTLETANDIYNQLLKQALAAKKKNGKTKELTFKLDIAPPKEENQTNVKKPMTGSKQVSEQPFLLSDPQINTRLDSLLSENKNTKLKGYFIQLSSSNSRSSVGNYYATMLKKHNLLLTDRPYLIRKFINKNDKVVYQLLISEFESYKQANSLCKLIKQQKSDCFVRQIK